MQQQQTYASNTLNTQCYPNQYHPQYQGNGMNERIQFCYQEQSWHQMTGWSGDYPQYPPTPVSMPVVSESVRGTNRPEETMSTNDQSSDLVSPESTAQSKRPGRQSSLTKDERALRRQVTNCIHQRYKRDKEKTFSKAVEAKDQARDFFLQQYFPMLESLEQTLLHTQMTFLSETDENSSFLHKEERLIKTQLFQEFVFQIRELKEMGRKMEKETRDADERMRIVNERNRESKKREKEELMQTSHEQRNIFSSGIELPWFAPESINRTSSFIEFLLKRLSRITPTCQDLTVCCEFMWMEPKKKPNRRPRKPFATVEEDDPSKPTTQKKPTTRRGNQFSTEALETARSFVKWAVDLGVEGLATLFREQLVNQRPPMRPAPSWEQNQDKNRYRDVICLEETRVKLDKEQPQEMDYIHANHIQLPEHDRSYIMTQAPMENTIVDFWRMIVQVRAPVIVNITQCYEDGRCQSIQYWPLTEGETKTFGRFSVLVKKKLPTDNGRLCTYILEILQEGCSDSHITRLVHATAWSDGGVAESAKYVLRVIKTIHSADTVAKNIPYVIHCTAGVGNTGTMVLIDYELYRIFQLVKPPNLVDMFLQLREQRASSVQLEAQFTQIAVCVSRYCALALQDPAVLRQADELEKNFRTKYGKN